MGTIGNKTGDIHTAEPIGDVYNTRWHWVLLHRSIWRLERVVDGRPEHFAICYLGGFCALSRTLDDQQTTEHLNLREAKAYCDALAREV